MTDHEIQALLDDLLSKIEVDSLLYNRDKLAAIVQKHTKRLQDVRRAFIDGPLQPDGEYHVIMTNGFADIHHDLTLGEKLFWQDVTNKAKKNLDQFGELQ